MNGPHPEQPGDEPASPPSPGDPRLEIPEVLRTPVRQSEYDPVHGSRKRGPAKPETSAMLGMGKAWATALDFVFTILAGAGIGWLIDYWLNSLPWGVLIGLTLGFITAFLRIIRATQREERAEQARRKRGQP